MNLYSLIDSPIGELVLVASEAKLTGILFGDNAVIPAGAQKIDPQSHQVLAQTVDQLEEYFSGQRVCFDLDIQMNGTSFQKRVWSELMHIPYGTTVSYGEQARRLGDKNASRAVGLANGRNPLAIVVPCHRVVGSAGQLTGYGGGLDRKQALLEFEKSVITHGPRRFHAPDRRQLAFDVSS